MAASEGELVRAYLAHLGVGMAPHIEPSSPKPHFPLSFPDHFRQQYTTSSPTPPTYQIFSQRAHHHCSTTFLNLLRMFSQPTTCPQAAKSDKRRFKGLALLTLVIMETVKSTRCQNYRRVRVFRDWGNLGATAQIAAQKGKHIYETEVVANKA